jgi:hypothetical protein
MFTATARKRAEDAEIRRARGGDPRPADRPAQPGGVGSVTREQKRTASAHPVLF